MPIVPSRLGQGLLKTTPTLIYTVPNSKLSATIRSIVMTNVTGAPHLVSLWLVPSGGVPGDSTAVIKDLAIFQFGGVVDDDVHVLMKGGQVYGATDTDDVFNMTVDGAENS